MTREERELSIEYLEGIKEKYIEGHGYERYPLPEYYAIENAIKVLEQEPRWVPISERLPNRDEYIKNNGLFNVSDGNRSYSEWFDIYDKQMFGEPTMNGFRADRAVTAWMPLPEAYKPKSEVQHE